MAPREGVVAPPAHRVRTAATTGGATPVRHPNMRPPKQPIEKLGCQHKTCLCRVMVASTSRRLLGTFFLQAS